MGITLHKCGNCAKIPNLRDNSVYIHFISFHIFGYIYTYFRKWMEITMVCDVRFTIRLLYGLMYIIGTYLSIIVYVMNLYIICRLFCLIYIIFHISKRRMTPNIGTYTPNPILYVYVKIALNSPIFYFNFTREKIYRDIRFCVSFCVPHVKYKHILL